MSVTARALMVFMAVATLLGAATPPTIEDHLEAGFCSADCPVQHDGPSVGIAPPPAPSAGRRSPAVVSVGVHRADAALPDASVPDAPRAPPAA